MPVDIQVRPSVTRSGGSIKVPRFITITIVGANDTPEINSINARKYTPGEKIGNTAVIAVTRIPMKNC